MHANVLSCLSMPSYLMVLSADGQFKKSLIAEFVSANKLPLVTAFSRESAPLIFESPIKKQVSENTGFLKINTSFTSHHLLPLL